MNANTRIQWLHKKISQGSYPNAHRLAERFSISHRQAQRDIDHLRKKLNAPLAYDCQRKGFYYSDAFTLPILLSSDNDESYIPEIFDVQTRQELAAEQSIIQMQIPYSATVEIKNKLTALELSKYTVERQPHDRYVCEFHSIEKFIGLLLSMDSDFKLIEPAWLREKVLSGARRVLKNHADETSFSECEDPDSERL